MKIKLRENQKRENLIFSVKELTDIYDDMIDNIIDDTIDYHVHDIVTATAQNDHSKLIQALNGFKDAISSQENNDKLINITDKLIDMMD